MRQFKKSSILFLILLLSSGSVFAERKVYDIRVDRENIYNQAQNHRNRLDTKFKSELNSELNKLGSTATKQQKNKVFDKLRAKYMQKHKVLDSAMTRLARGREFKRNELLKKAFKKVKVKFPAMTGTPPGKTGGILTDIDLSTISKKDAKKVYGMLKKMFGKVNVTMANGTISVANLDTTAFYPMKGGRYAPSTYNNSEYMHYFDKHAPVGNATSQLNVRKDYVYDNVKKMHSDLTSSPKSLLKDPDKLRNMSKSAFRLHGTTGGGKPVGPDRNAYKDSKKLLARFEKSLANGKPMKLSTIDKALLISKQKLSAEAVGLYPPGASESEKLTAIRKYRKEIKTIVNDSLEMAQNWDDTIEQQLKRKYNKAVRKGKTAKASAIKKAMMEMRARKIRAKIGIMKNGGSDLLAESMGMKVDTTEIAAGKTATGKAATGKAATGKTVVKTYYDPQTKKHLSKAQLHKRILKKDLKGLKDLSKMDEAFVAKQHAKNQKRHKLVKAVQAKTGTATKTSHIATKSSLRATDLADDVGSKTKVVFRKSAQKLRIIGKKIAPQLAARAGFGKALGWVGFLAALPQSMKDSEELTKTWITADDTDVSVYAKQFTSLSLHASGAKYMFDMFSNNVENRVLEFKQNNPGAWQNMTFQERIEVRKQSFKNAIWKTSGQMGKAIVVDMPKAMIMNTYNAAKEGTGLLGDKLDERSANKRMKQTQDILQQKKTQIALRSSDAKRDWQSLHKAYEKKHGKATQNYLKNPPKPIGNEQGANYEELLDLTYGQEIANSLDKARQDYKDAIKKAGGRKSGPGVSVALKRISSVTEMMEDYVSDPRNARKSGKAAQRLKEYQASVDKAQKEIKKQQSDAAKSKVKPKPKSTSKGNGTGIQVTSARYGKSKFCDATGFAKGQCDGKKACSFQVGNNMCGDPEFGVVKELKYTYKCVGGAAVSSTISEYNVAQMECSESEKASSSTDTSSTGASSTRIGPIRMSKSNKVTYKSTSSEVDRKYLSYITALQLFRALDDDHEYKAKAKSQLDVKYKIYMDAKRNSK